MEPAAMSIIPHMNPALYRAAMAGTLKDYDAALLQMTAEGAKDCQVAPNGNTVLHVAVIHGNKKFVEDILREEKAHASASSMLYALNDRKETALHCAAQKGDADMVCVLINAIKEYDEALESGVTVKEMIQTTDDVKDMALHKAARMGHLEVVKLLIEEDNEFLYPPNDAGETPIYLAAQSHNLCCLKEMIEKCQNPTYGGPCGANALHAAIFTLSGSRWESMMQMDLMLHSRNKASRGTFVAQLSRDKKLKQNVGRDVGRAGCIQLLLEKEISLCEMTNNLGWTPLHYAAKEGDNETVQKILEKKSSAAYIRAGKDNDDWTTIFHIAAKEGNIKTMECISNFLPDCWAMINCKSQNVLHEAILCGEVDMIKYLLKNPHIDNLVDQKDNDGNTPLHLLDVSRLELKDNNYIVTRLKGKHVVFNKRLETPPLMWISQRKHIAAGILPQRQETSREDTDNNIDKEINGFLRISKTMTLVATLILTISFAVAFTVPGGYDSKQGYPILLRKQAFSIFVVADTVAFICSVSAIFIYMIMVVYSCWFNPIRDKSVLVTLCIWNISLTIMALILVVTAFFSGIYAIFPLSHYLEVVGTTILTALLFILFIPGPLLKFNGKSSPFIKLTAGILCVLIPFLSGKIIIYLTPN